MTRVTIWRECAVWVVRVETERGAEEFADRSMYRAAAQAEAAHGPLLIDYVYRPAAMRVAA